MSRRPKKKKAKKKQSGTPQKQSPGMAENIAYYFLAAVGLLFVVLIVIGVLQYLGMF